MSFNSRCSSQSLVCLKTDNTSIVKSIQGLEDKKDMAFLYKKVQVDIEMMEEDDIKLQTQEREIAQKLLTLYIGDIAENLNAFCSNHLGDLKKTLITKSNKKKLPHGVFIKPTAHEIKNQTIKDLIFVMSEIANYLPSG